MRAAFAWTRQASLVPSLFDTRRHLPCLFSSTSVSLSPLPTLLLLLAAFSVRHPLSSYSWTSMASTLEPTSASPTPDSRASVEHEVQHEAGDGDSNTPSPKKPRRRKSRLLSGLDTANILPSPQSQGVVDNDDDDASASRTQSERRVKERPQREARLSNTRDQYDMKYVPARSAHNP